MPLETNPQSIEDLNQTYPEATDVYTQGDDHIRLIKDVLSIQFPGFTGQGFDTPITATEEEINFLTGVTSSLIDQYLAIEGSIDEVGESVPAPYGTMCFFNQASAPTGWEQIITYDDYMIRIVDTAGGTSGGTDSPFSHNWDHTHTTSAFSLNPIHMAPHKHDILTCSDSNSVVVNDVGKRISVGKGSEPLSSASIIAPTGVGVPHTHGDTLGTVSTFTPKYLNTILAKCITGAPILPEPTVYWSLDTATYISGEFQPTPDFPDHRLTVTGSVPTVAGYVGEAADFSGTNLNALAPSAAVGYRIPELDVQDHTLACWVKLDTFANDDTIISNCYFANGSGNSGNSGTWLGVLASGKPQIILTVTHDEVFTDSNGNSANSYAISATGSTVMTPGVWYHLVATFTSNVATLYVNGVMDSTVTSVQPQQRVLNTARFTIGCSITVSSINYTIDGVVDEVKCWDQALTDGFVLDLYNSYF